MPGRYRVTETQKPELGWEQTSPEYAASLSGAKVVPPNQTVASGFAHFSLDDTNRLHFKVSFNHVTSETTGLGIYRGAPGVNGALIYDLVEEAGFEREGFTSPVIGSLAFAPELLTDLDEGNLYVGLATTDFPNGEVRDQIIPGYSHVVEVRSGVVVESLDFANTHTEKIPNVPGVAGFGLIVMAVLFAFSVAWRRRRVAFANES